MNSVFRVKRSSFLHRRQKDSVLEKHPGTFGPAGIWTIIWFLILALFNSFLRMLQTTVGKLNGFSQAAVISVCFISHRQEKDDAAETVMNPDFMKPPSLHESV